MKNSIYIICVSLCLLGCYVKRDKNDEDARGSTEKKSDSNEGIDASLGDEPDTDLDSGTSDSNAVGSGGFGGGSSGTDNTTARGGVGGTSDAGGHISTSNPIIPSVTGDCPTFQTGDFTFMGLSGLMEVGPKQNGTGSLVFYWHGIELSAGTSPFTPLPASTYSTLGEAVISDITSAGGIIVSPEGPASGEEGGFCSLGVFGDSITWEIVDQIVACAVRDHDIDPHRIYSTGCTMGGLQSGCMALKRSSYVAAVATNSGGLVVAATNSGELVWLKEYQDPERIPAVMAMYTETELVRQTFSLESKTLIKQTREAGGFAVDCVHPGNPCGVHADLLEAAWEFLQDHPFGIDPKPYLSGLPASFPDYCTESERGIRY